MKENKIKAIQKTLAMIEFLIFLIPGILLEVIECAIRKVKTKNNKISGFLIDILEAVQMAIYLPLSPVNSLVNYLLNNLEKKLIDEDYEFQNFMKSKLCKRLLVSNKVKVTILFKSNDFNDNICKIYKAYNKAMEAVKELETNVSDDIKHGMNVLKSEVYLVSKSLYEKKFDEYSIGSFLIDSKSIHIKMDSETKSHLETLHHEIGHFIDLVAGYDAFYQSFDEFQSECDDILHEVFEEESKFLKAYGRTDYCEFFAVAYEHKMTKGVMSNLTKTDKLIKSYLNVFNLVISTLEYDSDLGIGII